MHDAVTTSGPPPVTPAAPVGLFSPAYRALTVGLVSIVTLVAFESLAVVTVLPDAISVSHAADNAAADSAGGERLSFELAIAQRISDRFAWPLELHAAGRPGVARVRFPDTLPVAA